MMTELISKNKKQHTSQNGALSQSKGAAVLQDNRSSVNSLQEFTDNRPTQLAAKPNNTGLPNQLKAGIESLSGMSMDHVKVHYNSAQPAQLNAHAYAQGSEIHLAPGQEKHLPHEAWHVVQQAQGRVKPTVQMKSSPAINNDKGQKFVANFLDVKASTESVQRCALSPMHAHSTAPIQRYAEKEGYKISEDALYATHDSQKTTLWVSKVKGAPAPAPNKFFAKTGGNTDWDTYVPKADFTKPVPDAAGTFQGGNDCGFYAGALAAGNSDWRQGASMGEFRDKTSGKALGQNAQGHTANLTAENYKAAPDIGEAYFIWPSDSSVNPHAVHHVSTVIARDKDDRVTSEADCSDPRTHPHFEMFGTKTDAQTFLAKNWQYFTSQAARDAGQTDARVAVLHRPKPVAVIPPPLAHAPPVVHPRGASGSVAIDIESGLVPSGDKASGAASEKNIWNIFGLWK